MEIKSITSPTWPCLTPNGYSVFIQGNILHPTINPNQGNPYKERIPPITCIYEDLSYKERPSPPRNDCQLYATIKTPKPSQTKVRIIYPSSGTLEWWTFSNLTFGGYLAGITPILSVRFSSSLLRRSCLKHVSTVQLTNNFRHHQLAPSVGRSRLEATLPLSWKKVTWYLLA